MRRFKRRAALGVLFAGLCALALLGLALQALGLGATPTESTRPT